MPFLSAPTPITASDIDRKYYRIMIHWAIRAGVAVHDAPDIVQEAMIEAVRAEPLLSTLGEAQRFSWLQRTVTRKAIDANRYRTRAKRSERRTISLSEIRWSGRGRPAGPVPHGRGRASDEPLANDTSPSRRAAIKEIGEAWLYQLDESERVVCALILKEMLTPEQVAARLGLTVEDVGLRLASGLRCLKGLLSHRAK